MTTREEMTALLVTVRPTCTDCYSRLVQRDDFDEGRYLSHTADLYHTVYIFQTTVLQDDEFEVDTHLPTACSTLIAGLTDNDGADYFTKAEALTHLLAAILPRSRSLGIGADVPPNNLKVFEELKPQANLIRTTRERIESDGGSIDEAAFKAKNGPLGLARQLYMQQLADVTVEAEFMDAIECQLHNNAIEHATEANFLDKLAETHDWIETKIKPALV